MSLKPPEPERFPVVAFDLDGTLATDTWPSREIGEPIPEGVELLKYYANEGYGVVIFTARQPHLHDEIVGWLKHHGLSRYVDEVHCGRKPMAGLYIDDRSWNPAYTKLYRR